MRTISGEQPAYVSNDYFFELNTWTHFAIAFSTLSDKLAVYKNGNLIIENHMQASVSYSSALFLLEPLHIVGAYH